MVIFLIIILLPIVLCAICLPWWFTNAKREAKRQAERERLALSLSPLHHKARQLDYSDREQAHRHRMEWAKFHHSQLYLPAGITMVGVSQATQWYTTPPAPRTIVQEEKTPAAIGTPGLVASGLAQPTQRYLLDQLEENGLQVSPGIRASDGQPIVLSIPDAVHFKLIGSSGFGKSCLAAALLDQAIRLNSPEVLQVALLDLEHKTSRLFENVPNVATLTVGRRTVQMVATSADEVALHLGYLKKELDRRAALSEYDLQGEPLMLIYVEEMLSLQFEVDEDLLGQMLKDLSVLAVRARKYNMFLLACSQTDYSTPELKTAQKQFRSRMAFAIDTTAARAAGFMSTHLIKYSFANSQPGDGMYVLETPGVASLMLAPVYNVKQKVLALDARSSRFQHVSSTFQDGFIPEPLRVVSSERKDVKPLEKPYVVVSENNEKPVNSRLSEVQKLREMAWGKVAIIEKVWGAKPGGSAAWKVAQAEYEAIIAEIEQQKEEA